jgi:hypothetical protein
MSQYIVIWLQERHLARSELNKNCTLLSALCIKGLSMLVVTISVNLKITLTVYSMLDKDLHVTVVLKYNIICLLIIIIGANHCLLHLHPSFT